MKAAKRVGLEIIGWVLLLAGIAALILPGPGLLMVFGGLAVLSQQYEWAAKRVDPIKYRALKGAAESVESPLRIVISIAGVLFLVACGLLWIKEPDAPGWWPIDEKWWLVGGPWTGVTLILSAVIAAGLVVYAYIRFHGKPEAVAALEEEIDEADREFKELREH